MKTDNLIQNLTFQFSLDIIKLYQMLVAQKEFILSKQLLRSATGIGANVEEGIAAQSRKDFISKMAIAAKEARETRYWLRLLAQSKLADLDYTMHLQSADHIINVLKKLSKLPRRTSLHNFMQRLNLVY